MLFPLSTRQDHESDLMIFMNCPRSQFRRSLKTAYTGRMIHPMTEEPTLADIEAMSGPVLLEFGASWCGYCRAARGLIDSAMAGHAQVRHLRIEDGKGKRLGRAFRVKLWPTLVFLLDGRELHRLVRPDEIASIRQALTTIDPGLG